jgi:hypothetical protein
MRTNQIKINHLGKDNSYQDNPSDKDGFRWVKYHHYNMFTKVIASLRQKKVKPTVSLGSNHVLTRPSEKAILI